MNLMALNLGSGCCEKTSDALRASRDRRRKAIQN